MIINAAIRAHLEQKHGLPANANDVRAKALLGSLVAKGVISAATLKSLSATAPPPNDLDVSKGIHGAANGALGNTNGGGTNSNNGAGGSNGDPNKKNLSFSVFADNHVAVYNGDPNSVRIRNPLESFDGTRKAAIAPLHVKSGLPHPMAGQQVSIGSDPLDLPSQQDVVKWQAWFKYMLSHQIDQKGLPPSYRLTDLDRQVVDHMVNEDTFTGKLKAHGKEEAGLDVFRRKMNDFERKALLDDAVSGGIEIAPVIFDDMIVTFPLLFGEVFPRVKLVPLSTGRRVKSGKLNLPTLTSGTVEGQPIQPYDTASFIQAFDTPIYNAVGALEYGLDLEEDSPVAFGAQILDAYQRRHLEWLDRVISVGNGVNEPLGVFNTPGIVMVPSVAGVSGPLFITDAEDLQFGVQKQYRSEGGSKPIYLSNDTMYKRFRKIQVGPGDQRRPLGMDYAKYTLLEYDYAIQNDIPNGKIAYFNPQRYRMYRRLGIQMRVETAGRALALSNTKIIVVRMRYGGQMETANAIAAMNDAWV